MPRSSSKTTSNSATCTGARSHPSHRAPRFPRAGYSILVLCLCAGGCSLVVDAEESSRASQPEVEGDAESGFAELSAGVHPDSANTEGSQTPVAVPEVCTADGIATAVCEGTWRYQQWASCTVSDTGSVTPATCSSALACTSWNSCEDWSFGAGAPATKVETYQHQVSTCRDRGCFNACDEQRANIQAAYDALLATVPPEYQDQVIIAQEEETVVSSRRYSPGFLEDDKFDEVRQCTVTFEYPTPASGEAVVCGCAAFECRSAGCGVDPNQVTSSPGLTFEEVRAQDPNVADTTAPSCSSCDAIPREGPVTTEPS